MFSEAAGQRDNDDMDPPLVFIVVLLLSLPQVCSALDKSRAVGPCVNGHCPPVTFCAADNECYPKAAAKKLVQRDTPQSIGACINGLCPAGYQCTSDNTCRKAPKDGEKSIGPCVNSLCPDGYSCNPTEYKCYSQH